MKRLFARCAVVMSWAAASAASLAGAGAARADEVGVVDPHHFPLRVDEIRIEGLARTKPYVVRREIGFSEGRTITRADFDLAVTRLWNTGIFAQVEAKVVHDGRRNILVYTIEDRWTLAPLFSFGTGGGATFVRVGIAENNLLGHYLDVQGQYEYFDGYSGGQLILHDPRFLNERLEVLMRAERLVRPRPGFSDQRSQVVLEVARLLESDRVRIGGRATVLSDRFLEPIDGSPYFPDPSAAFQFEPAFRLGRVDTIRIRQTGTSIELRPGVGVAKETYATTLLDVLAFAMVGERWNFAAHLRAADVSNVPAQLQLYGGGLDHKEIALFASGEAGVRGFPDNFIRTHALAVFNGEVRFTVFDSTWFALVPVLFADAGAAVSPVGKVGTLLSSGLGFRFLIPKFVGTGLRLDFAVPIASTLRPVTLPDQGRFGPATPNADMGSIQTSIGVYQFF